LRQRNFSPPNCKIALFKVECAAPLIAQSTSIRGWAKEEEIEQSPRGAKKTLAKRVKIGNYPVKVNK
jgi:hypothetical protein